MYVHQAKPANADRTAISSSLMGVSESSFDYPPTNERRCAFQSRIKYTCRSCRKVHMLYGLSPEGIQNSFHRWVLPVLNPDPELLSAAAVWPIAVL
jgi:hypothetical protein